MNSATLSTTQRCQPNDSRETQYVTIADMTVRSELLYDRDEAQDSTEHCSADAQLALLREERCAHA